MELISWHWQPLTDVLWLVPNQWLKWKWKIHDTRRANMLTHLRKLQPAERAARRGAQLEVLLGRHPGLHGLQLARGQVGGVVLHQVALKLVRLKVEMHRHRVAHGEVPGRAWREWESISKPDSGPSTCCATSQGQRCKRRRISRFLWLLSGGGGLGHANVAGC